jgi:hypothetical protein
MHYKRRRCRRKVRCCLCTPHRLGNSRKDWGSRKHLKDGRAERNRHSPEDMD